MIGRAGRKSSFRLLAYLRERMAEACEVESPFGGTVDVDESYFGPPERGSFVEGRWRR